MTPEMQGRIFDYIRANLKLKVEDRPTKTDFGHGTRVPGVKVTLLMRNPRTGVIEEIDSDYCELS